MHTGLTPKVLASLTPEEITAHMKRFKAETDRSSLQSRAAPADSAAGPSLSSTSMGKRTADDRGAGSADQSKRQRVEVMDEDMLIPVCD